MNRLSTGVIIRIAATIIFSAAFLSAQTPSTQPATQPVLSIIRCKDGRKLTGQIVSRDKGQLIIQTMRGATSMRIPLAESEIESIAETAAPMPIQSAATTQPADDADGPDDAFVSLRALASRVKGILRDVDPMPANLTEAQKKQLSVQRDKQWQETLSDIGEAIDSLQGKKFLLTGQVDEVIPMTMVHARSYSLEPPLPRSPIHQR